VARASPLALYTAQRPINGREQQFTVVGYDIFGGAGGPGRLVEGRTIGAPHYELVADRKLGLKLGDRVPLGTDQFTVVGITRGAVDSGGNPLVYMALADAQKVQFEQDKRAIDAAAAANRQRLDRAGYTPEQATRLLPLLSGGSSTINAVLVTLAPGADGEAVAEHVRNWLYFNVYTMEQERELMLEGKLSRMSAVLGLFRTLLILVSIVIIALIVYVLTIEKIKSIATLKLIGAPNSLIVRLIMTQSLLLTLASFVLAYVLRDLIAPNFPRTLAFVAPDTAVTFGVMLVGGVLARLLAVWHALRTPAQLALGG
jgi:putative ABC transport system permease protein